MAIKVKPIPAINEGLHARIKLYCVQNNITMTKWITETLDKALNMKNARLSVKPDDKTDDSLYIYE